MIPWLFNMGSFSPRVTALQLRLQPVVVSLPSVWKNISTLLLLVIMIGGRKYSDQDGSCEEKPQLLFIKVVPSPSVILTKSHEQVVISQAQTAKWVNSSLNIFPLSTSSISVLSRL